MPFWGLNSWTIVQHKDIASEFEINRAGWQKWYGDRVIARREISKGEPECFTGNSKCLFNCIKTTENLDSAKERKHRNSG